MYVQWENTSHTYKYVDNAEISLMKFTYKNYDCSNYEHNTVVIKIQPKHICVSGQKYFAYHCNIIIL